MKQSEPSSIAKPAVPGWPARASSASSFVACPSWFSSRADASDCVTTPFASRSSASWRVTCESWSMSMASRASGQARSAFQLQSHTGSAGAKKGAQHQIEAGLSRQNASSRSLSSGSSAAARRGAATMDRESEAASRAPPTTADTSSPAASRTRAPVSRCCGPGTIIATEPTASTLVAWKKNDAQYCVSTVCLASTHTALVSSPSLAVLHLSTYCPQPDVDHPSSGPLGALLSSPAPRPWM